MKTKILSAVLLAAALCGSVHAARRETRAHWGKCDAHDIVSMANNWVNQVAAVHNEKLDLFPSGARKPFPIRRKQ